MVRFDDEPISGDLNPGETAVIVVDMMNEFVEEGAILETPMAREFVPNIKRTVDQSRALGAPIVYLKQRNRRSGLDAGGLANITPQIMEGTAHNEGHQTEIYPELAPEPEDVVVEKQTYNGFFNTELDTVLRGLGVSNVAITGVATHICNDSTMRGAFFRGYNVVAIEDCSATFDITDQGWGDVSAEEINRVWFSIVSSNFGDVMDSDEFIERLEQAADAPRVAE